MRTVRGQPDDGAAGAPGPRQRAPARPAARRGNVRGATCGRASARLAALVHREHAPARIVGVVAAPPRRLDRAEPRGPRRSPPAGGQQGDRHRAASPRRRPADGHRAGRRDADVSQRSSTATSKPARSTPPSNGSAGSRPAPRRASRHDRRPTSSGACSGSTRTASSSARSGRSTTRTGRRSSTPRRCTPPSATSSRRCSSGAPTRSCRDRRAAPRARSRRHQHQGRRARDGRGNEASRRADAGRRHVRPDPRGTRA